MAYSGMIRPRAGWLDLKQTGQQGCTWQPGCGHKPHQQGHKGQDLSHVHESTQHAKEDVLALLGPRQIVQPGPHDQQKPVAGQPNHLQKVEMIQQFQGTGL